MTEDDFYLLLDNVYSELCTYDAKFSRDHFEIAVLMSRTAVQLFTSFNGLYTYVQDDPHDFAAYLFGHKIVFVDDDFIMSHDGSRELIRPVIGCKEIGHFPMEAAEGDYVFFNGRLKQVKYEHFIDGQRSLEVWNVDVDLYENASDLYPLEMRLDRAVRAIKKKKVRDDAWINNVDSSEINSYLASLTIL